MDHITLKAVATPTTDQGVFEAVISTEAVDREKDIVRASAMVAALKKWNRPIPLAWEHSTKAEDIFGTIEPMTVREVDGEVVAQGQVDLESEVGQHAWRAFKARSLGFSFAYLIPDGGAKARAGGGKEITEMDVFEVTATRTPMNNATRVLGTKAAEAVAEAAVEAAAEAVVDAVVEVVEPTSEEELRHELARHKAAEETKGLPEVTAEDVAALKEPEPTPEPAAPKVVALEAELRNEFARHKATEETKNVPEVPPGPAPEVVAIEKAVSAVEGLSEKFDEFRTEMDERVRRVEQTPPEAKQREELVKHKADEELKDVPDVEPGPSPLETLSTLVKELGEKIEDHKTEMNTKLEEVKVSAARKAFEPDPLKSESRRTVLDIQSGGASSRKSPIPVSEPVPEPTPEWQVKAQIRSEMAELLTELPLD